MPAVLAKPVVPLAPGPTNLRFCEIISALSFALDLTEGRPMGHSVRSCIIGMRLGAALRLPERDLRDLYYALLLKDVGCSSNASRLFHILGADEIAAKRDVKTTDWTKLGWESLQYAWQHIRTESPLLERIAGFVSVAANQKRESRALVQIRCERGACIARQLKMSEQTAQAIHSLDEHWSGQGHPQGLRRDEIPVLSRILNIAQTLEVFYTQRGAMAAIEVVRARAGKWFDPALVRAATALDQQGVLWQGLEGERATAQVHAMEPLEDILTADGETLDNVCAAFAGVIDAKSPYTFNHSTGVAAAASKIAVYLGLSPQQQTTIQRAALLHDIGKLSVPNSILEKPGKLTSEEWQFVARHPYYTKEILVRVPGFEELSEIACNHHERLDGNGYFRGLSAPQLNLSSRILAIADVYDALSTERPYRRALDPDVVFKIMGKDAPHSLDSQCLDALRESAR